MTRHDVPDQAPRSSDPDARQLSGHPGPWAVWTCRLAALGVWATFTMGGLFLWALSYAGPNRQDERGMTPEPSQAEEIAVVTLLVVLLVLMLSAVEVPLRAGLRSTVRWFGSLGLGAAVLLYLSLESWNPAANVTSVGATIAVATGLLGGAALVLGTRKLDNGAPRWCRQAQRRP